MKKTFVALLFIISGVLSAQSKLHVFLGPGVAYYQGDVSQSGLPHPSLIKFNAKIGVGYDFTPRWGLRLHGSMGSLNGSDFITADPGRQARGITFNTNIVDVGLTFKWNVLKREKLINYVFIGADYFNMNVARTVASTTPLPAEQAFSNHQFNIPLGFGIGRWFGCRFGMAFESAWHLAFTDYIDGTKFSGNPKAPDSYIDAHLLLVFRFGKCGNGKKKEYMGDCPQF